MIGTKTVMSVALALFLVVVVWVIQRRNNSRASAVNLDDLLIGDDGKVSRGAIVMLGAFAMTTWMMIYLTLQGKMSEGYLSIYNGMWIAPTLLYMYIKRPQYPDAPAPVQNTTIQAGGTVNLPGAPTTPEKP